MNWGLRFSLNARTASLASAEPRFTTWAGSFRLGRLREGCRERLVEEVLGLRQRDRRHLEQPRDDGVDGVVELGGGHHPVHDADALGLAGVDHLGEERQLLGLVHADEARQQPRAAVVDAQAALHEDRAEAGDVGRDHEVAAEREVAAPRRRPRRSPWRSSACAMSRSAAALRPTPRMWLEPSHPVPRGMPASTRSAPAQKPVAGTGDHEHAVVAVGRDLVEHVARLAPHRAGDRVLLLGPVERERHDAVASLDEQVRTSAATVAVWASTRSGPRPSAAATS